jgi:hypothetical protein
MNRVLVTSLLATTTGAALMFAAHGCSLSILTDYTYDEAKEELSGSSSSGAGGTGGATTTSSSSGNPGCKCVDDKNPCTTDVPAGQNCPTDESSCHTPAPATACTDVNGNPAFCNADGKCTPCSECSDANCVHRCQGQSCAGPANCANGLCVDGFCCDTDCMGECNACNRVLGTCTPLPVGMVGQCKAGQYCGNDSSCKAATKTPLGGTCGTAANCESGACVGQVCVSLNEQPCVENLECASRLCDSKSNKCIPCGGSATCPNGAGCVNGTCQALPGQPAATSAECKPPAMVHNGLTCSLAVNAICKDNSECIYHDCNLAPNGLCASPCMFDAECMMGTTCAKAQGWCLLPSGSFCMINDQCQGPNGTIGVCSGFPRRCQ